MASSRQAKAPATGSVTLRFDEKILKELRSEADQKRTSLNTLATQIFKTHVEFGAYAIRAGMVSFPKDLLIRIMDRLSEAEVKALSEHIAKNSMKDTLLIMKSSYTKESFIELIESWIRVSGFFFRHAIHDGTHSVVIQHDMGRRWSLYLANFFKYVFDDLGAKWADFQITENTVVFNVDI